MANSKITALTELTSVANDDVLVIVDNSATETKKISFANLSAGISVGTASSLQFTALNSTGSTITKGSAVYVSGHTTETQVAPAANTSASTMPAFGIATDDIANGASGTIVISGEISGVNTSAFSIGDELYVGTAGALTATKPTGTAIIQKVAQVTKAAASGEILVTGAGRVNDLPNLADGKIWIGESTGVPTEKTLTQGSGITITEDSTSVTIAATGGGGGLAAVVDDTSPQLGGNLDVQAREIDTSTTNGNIILTANGTGLVQVKGNTNPGSVRLMCESNTHGVTIKSPPHIATADYTLTLPEDDGAANQPMVTDGSGVLSFGTTIKASVQGPVIGAELNFEAQSTAVDASTVCEGTVVKFGTSASSMTAGKVYTFASGAWVEADADASATTQGLLGVALGASPTTNGLLIHGIGYLSHDPGAAGNVLYVHTTAGELNATQPSAVGDFVRVAGYCLADNKVFFSPSQDFIEIGS